MELLEGAKHFTKQLTMKPGNLVIIDDMQATHAYLLSAWFTHKSHHYDTSIIHLVQNFFDKDHSHRTIGLNATYIVLFKNPRDMSQVSHLDKQVYPGGNGLLTAAYHNAAAARDHSYMVIDFNQATPEKFPLHNTLFPDEEFPEALAYGPASQPWTGRRTSNVGEGEHKDHPSTAGGVIDHHTLAVAAGLCAAEVPHQRLVRHRRCQWRPQQQRWWGCRDSTAVARKRHHCHARPRTPGVIPCNLCRHVNAICIIAKAQPRVIKLALTRTWSTPSRSAPPTSSKGTWSCSPLRSSVCALVIVRRGETFIQACGRPENLPTADSESACQEGPTNGQQLHGPAGGHCGTAAHEVRPLDRGWHRLPGQGPKTPPA